MAALPAIDPLVYGSIVLFTAVIGFSAILLATRAALRGRPVDAVGADAWRVTIARTPG
jgi:putative ABC transport system permease protein